MTEKANKLTLEKRLERLERHIGGQGIRIDGLEQLQYKHGDSVAALRRDVGWSGLVDTPLSERVSKLETLKTDTEKRLAFVEVAIEDLTETTAKLTADKVLSPLQKGNCLTPDVIDSIRSTCNRLAREAVSINLGITDIAPLHGARWADDDERKLYRTFNSFLRAQSVNLGRTESGLRIKLLRLLKDEHPVDWQIAGKER